MTVFTFFLFLAFSSFGGLLVAFQVSVLCVIFPKKSSSMMPVLTPIC